MVRALERQCKMFLDVVFVDPTNKTEKARARLCPPKSTNSLFARFCVVIRLFLRVRSHHDTNGRRP